MEEGALILSLEASPLAPGRAPVPIACRRFGAGTPLLFLHGGWGYEAYPFDRQIAALKDRYRVFVPDRTGYGGSGRIERLPIDFHRRAAVETLAVIDALQRLEVEAGVEGARERPVLWGHSDGAVIALHAGLLFPERIAGIVAEATHLLRRKPASRQFFETVARSPERLDPNLLEVFERDHGADWRRVIAMTGDAWLRLADLGPVPAADLYDGTLPSLRVPTLLVHGARDPRTEPNELRRLRTALCRPAGSRAGHGATLRSPHRTIVFAHTGHSPHTSRRRADHVTRTAAKFLDGLARPSSALAR